MATTGRKMSRLKLLGLLLVSSVLVQLSGCGEDAANEVKIGVILPLTGEAAFYGESVKNGLDLAAEGANASGGIKGASISLIYEDSRAMPAEGVSAFERLASISGLSAVVGDAVSSVTLAFAPIANQREIVVMSPLSSAPAITDAGDFIFRNVPSDRENGRTAADFAVSEKAYGRLGVLYVNNDFGVGLEDAFSGRAAQLGAEVVATESYDPAATDFRTQLAKIHAGQPEAVFLVGYSELATALVQATELGMEADFLGTGLMEDPTFVEATRGAAEGVYFTQLPYDPTSEDPATATFVNGYRLKFGEEANIMAAYGYDALGVLISAMRTSDLTPAGIRGALYGIEDYTGPTGSIAFNQDGDITQPMGIKVVTNDGFAWVSRPKL